MDFRINLALRVGIGIGLLLQGAATAKADSPVTFQVDMSAAVANGVFDPATQTLAARGTFNAWGVFPLTNNPAGPSPNLWTGTTNVAGNGTVMSYKYTIEPAGTFETIASGGSHNRLITLPATAGASLTLPLVYYADTPPAPVTVAVTFQVNLAQQINIKAFDPAVSLVYTRGFFNSWDQGGPMTNNPTILTTNQFGLVSSNVYVYTFDVTGSPGQTTDFKYYIDPGANWESPTPGSGDPADNNNRFFNLGEGPTQTVPIIYFNDAAYAPVATNAVTFQVDMSAQILMGAFVSEGGTVELRGNFNGWGTPQILCTNDPAATNPNLYSVTTPIVDGIGATEQYKFWAAVSANGGWETMADNRTFQVISGKERVLPVVFFSNQDPAKLFTIGRSGADIILTWPAGTLQEATEVGGTFSDVDGAASPYTVPVDAARKFYRVKYQ